MALFYFQLAKRKTKMSFSKIINSNKTPDMEDLSKYLHSEKHLKLRSTFLEYQTKFPEIDTLVETLGQKVIENSALTKQIGRAHVRTPVTS